MGIPLQSLNMKAWAAPDPFLRVEQIASGLQNMRAQQAHMEANKQAAALAAPLTQAHTAVYQAQAGAIPMQAQAALYHAQHPQPQMVYGMQINPFTNQSVIYNKLTGALQGQPGFQARASLGAPSGPATQAARPAAAPSLGAPVSGAAPEAPQESMAPADLGQAPSQITNLLTHSPYRPGGTQTLLKMPSGQMVSTTTPTQSAQTSQQIGEAGEQAFEQMYPALSQTVNDFGSSGYGAGLKAAVKTLRTNPDDPSSLNKLALFLAVDRLEPTISADLARMAKGGVPGEKTMAEYGQKAFAQLPKAKWARAILTARPKLAAKVSGIENDYYFQLEKEMIDARSRSVAGGSGVALAPGTQLGGMGQPLGRPLNIPFGHPLSQALQPGGATTVRVRYKNGDIATIPKNLLTQAKAEKGATLIG